MTVYEKLKKKETILIEASWRAESQDMKELWLLKAKELNEKLKSLADADKRSKSAYVRIVLEEHVKKVDNEQK